MSHAFLKMNGLGNDFVIVPEDETPFTPSLDFARSIADRATGPGCDQLITLSRSDRADARMRIWNADGGEVGACGNATRCVGWLLMQASGRDQAVIETAAGLLYATAAGEMRVSVDMGPPGLDWQDIPLTFAADTRSLDLFLGEGLDRPGAVSMGNPHAVYFVDDADAAPVARMGPVGEHHPMFPERANVGFAQIKAWDRIRLRVWERGVGETLACGTGACAALVAAHRRGLTGRSATLEMNGGDLLIEWRESDEHVLMTGAVELNFTGRLSEPRDAA